MQKLEKRIAALESANPAAGFPKTIIIRIVEPVNLTPDYNHMSAEDGTVWTRRTGEDAQDFEDRARREVVRNERGMARLVAKEVRHAKH